MIRRRYGFLLLLLGALLAACGASLDPVIPTAVPTVTLTPTDVPATQMAATRVAAATSTPSLTPSRPPATGGPSPTSIVGPTHTRPALIETPTPRPNPNAPRIEYFTADLAYVYPGDALTLYWSVRGAGRAAIYRLDDLGQRNRLWNVDSNGSLVVQTGENDRGVAEFLLTVDDGTFYVEQVLAVPLLCADLWFFEPAPQACPQGPEVSGAQIEQLMEGGRMVYVEATDEVYVLFADGRSPAWTSFQNRYVEGETPDQDESFVPPPERYQPTRILGVIWRASDPVRNRLRLGLEPEVAYEGALQTDGEAVYLRSADGSILQLDPGGESWSVLAPP